MTSSPTETKRVASTAHAVPTAHPVPTAHTHVTVDVSLRTGLVMLGLFAVVWLLLQLWQILVVLVVALMIVGVLNPFVESLERRGMRRGVGIGVAFGTLFLLAGIFMALTLPRLFTQVAGLVHNFPETRARFAEALDKIAVAAPLATAVRDLKIDEISDKAKEYGLSYGPKIGEIAAYGVTAFFLALYMMIDRDRMRGSMFALVPRAFHLRVSRTVMNLETIVGGYMRGQLITSVLMAVFTFIVLLIAGVPNALALALFAGAADVLPYVGALLACLPAAAAALPSGTTTAFVVLIVLAVYQEIESRFIIPRVYGKTLRLPAATVMIALLVGAKLLGILGALLALPVAAGIRMIIAEWRVDLPGEDVDDSALRAKDAQAEAEFEARSEGVPAEAAAAIASEIVQEHQGDAASEAHNR